MQVRRDAGARKAALEQWGWDKLDATAKTGKNEAAQPLRELAHSDERAIAAQASTAAAQVLDKAAKSVMNIQFVRLSAVTDLDGDTCLRGWAPQRTMMPVAC